MESIRKSIFSPSSPSPAPSLLANSAAQDTASMQMEFEVEEEQVLTGVRLIYSDKLNDAEDYFHTLRAGHARFYLHHAEVATIVALMSHDDDDINFAISLLQATEAFASEQEVKYRTHSNIKKVNETVSSMKSWALGKAVAVLEKSGFEKAAALSDKLKQKEDDPEVKIAMTREETNTNHKLRRMRLWCLYIQAECFLFIGLLAIVAGGERWSSMVKVGYNLKRAWLIYKHSRKKLMQVQREWVAMGGSLQGELSGSLRVNYDSDDDEQSPNSGSAVPSTSDSQTEAGEEGWQTRQRRLSESPMIEMGAAAARCNLQRLEGSIKEDQELASLRISIEFGMGAFNLMVSLIPAQYHKALELLGMPGDRARAIILLHRVSTTHHARAPLAALFLLHYHTVIMALLPPTRNHMESATAILDSMEPTWKGGCMVRIMESRLARLEGNLAMATDSLSNHTLDLNLRGFNLRLRNLMLDEMGWCLLLQGHYDKAAVCFDSLFKETVWFKPFYCCLRSACLWESSDPGSRQEGGRMLEDISILLSAKKGKLSPMELFVNRMSTDYVTLGLVPLHPALEVVAVYNGFQHMSRLRVEELMALLDTDIHRHSKRHSILDLMPTLEPLRTRVNPEVFSLVMRRVCLHLFHKSIFTNACHTGFAQRSQMGQAKRRQVRRGQRKGLHKCMGEPSWMKRDAEGPGLASAVLSTLLRMPPAAKALCGPPLGRASMVTCRYLLALCLLNLTATKAAEEHLRKVVAATDIPTGSKATLSPTLGNIAPYACYELGSLLLDRDTSGDGLGLLEKSTSFPFHEFQTRLKFMVGERLKRFH